MTPLVLVHGFLGGSAQWDDLRTRLGDAREIIAVDLPGFGANADRDPIDRIEGLATWVIDTLHAMGATRYHLLGHSMGGMIAQEVARLDPQALDRLVLYGTGPQGALPGRFETLAESRRRARSGGATATARRISATWLKKREASEHFPAVSRIAKRADLRAIEAGLTAMENWSGLAKLAEIQAETLIIWGDCDRSYDWSQIELLWKQIPKASLCVLPRCAHLAHLEAPAAMSDIVQRFIDDIR